MGQRKLDPECRTTTHLGIEAYGAIHACHDLPADVQAQPGTARAPRGRGIGLGEALENAPAKVFRDAGSARVTEVSPDCPAGENSLPLPAWAVIPTPPL
jgi:hypothetical protein